MKTSMLFNWKSTCLAAALTLVLIQPAKALIVGPYTTDFNTLHLWHLDEGATPSADAATGGTNLVGLLFGATLGNPSFSGFGNSVSTLDGGQDGTAAATRDALIAPSAVNPPGNIAFPYCDPVTGAFTFEALVWVGFDPDKNLGTTANGGNNRNVFLMIMTGESTANGNRIFQWRICPKGVAPGGTGNPAIATQPLLTFENIRTVSANQPTIFATIPTNGPNAIVSNQWYHVAVSYNGIPDTADNIKFYWTLMDSTRTNADQLPITSTQTTLNGPLPLGTATTSIVLGNTARNITTAGNNFLGRLDEVRVSKIARATNGMVFAQAEPLVLTPPASVTALQGQGTTLTTVASGAPPLTYQWRHAGTNLPGATVDNFAIPSIQAQHTGTYDVIVTNASGSITSAPANVVLRTPIDVNWIGSAGGIWNTSLINWDTNNDATADTVYTQGDNVTFGSAGSAVPTVLITNGLTPHAIIVNANTDYTLTTTNNSLISGTSQLTKSGTGTLILDVESTYTGPTTINAGTVQMGTGGARGSLGVGAVTNNGLLNVFRTGTTTFGSYLVGTGSLTNLATNSIVISGTNTMSGPITLNAGSLTLSGAAARGNSTVYTLNAVPNSAGPTRLVVGGGMTFGPGTTISLLGANITGDYRAGLNSSDSTNTFSGNVVFGPADGNIQFSSDGPASNSLFRVNTPLNSPSFAGQLILRGVGNGIVTSPITVGGKVSKTDGGTWTITATGNTWYSNDMAGGTLKMGANNVMPPLTDVRFTGASTLDLAGFNQQIGFLVGTANGVIASSSTTSDATISVNSTQPGALYSGVIRDSVSNGTRRVGLTIPGGALTLGGTNTYTGDTIISSGTLNLFVTGCISNSANIIIANGGTLDVSFRTDTTLVVNPGQTLKGNGVINIVGNVANAGTIELKANKSGAILSNDSINGANIAFGGTLKIDVTASPALTTSDTFTLFTGGSFSGAFNEAIPAPGFGLAWDTSTLATDGVLRITTSTVPTTSTNITFTAVGDQMQLSWPANYIGWRLQSQTNGLSVGISTNWYDFAGSSTTNQVYLPLNAVNGSVFFRMVYP